MDAFHLQILAADRPYYTGECESLTVPAQDGKFGILAHHSPMLAAIVPGVLHFRIPGKKQELLSVSSGLVKIGNNEVIVLVNSIERPEEINVERARHAEQAAMEALKRKQTPQEYQLMKQRLARAVSRLHIKEQFGRMG